MKYRILKHIMTNTFQPYWSAYQVKESWRDGEELINEYQAVMTSHISADDCERLLRLLIAEREKAKEDTREITIEEEV